MKLFFCLVLPMFLSMPGAYAQKAKKETHAVYAFMPVVVPHPGKNPVFFIPPLPLPLYATYLFPSFEKAIMLFGMVIR